MKIYFSGSIRGGRDDQERYAEIIAILKSHGVVLTEFVGDASLSSAGTTSMKDADIYDRDVRLIRESDAVVAEVTTPSLGVGYEIAIAEQLGKPVLCLFYGTSERRLSAMIAGNPNVKIAAYQKDDEAKNAIESFFANLAA